MCAPTDTRDLLIKFPSERLGNIQLIPYTRELKLNDAMSENLASALVQALRCKQDTPLLTNCFYFI